MYTVISEGGKSWTQSFQRVASSGLLFFQDSGTFGGGKKDGSPCINLNLKMQQILVVCLSRIGILTGKAEGVVW